MTRFKTLPDAPEIILRLQPENDVPIPLASFDDVGQARAVMSVVIATVTAVKPRPKVNLELYRGDDMLDAFDQSTEEEEAQGYVR